MGLADKPCEVVTAQMVAGALDAPAEALEQTQPLTSRCAYAMDEGDETLQVEVAVDAYETDAAAAEYFQASTRSMTLEEIAEATADIRAEAGDDEDAAGSLAEGVLQNGIQFEDVDDLADQARIETGDGTLHLQAGNLLITLGAFHGPAMPIPDEITTDAIMKAMLAWQQDTLSTRREQAKALARAALAAL